jgi:putative DNA-invertase from lambdoid prophage Rac
MKRNVAVYLRVSTEKQSSDMQLNEVNRFIEIKGWNIVRVYEDKLSGSTSKRPGLQEMLRDAESKKFEVIVTYKLDRFFRSLKELLTTLHDLHESGIDFVAVRDNLDFTTSSGRLMVHLLGAIAQFERELIHARVVAGIENAKKKGVRLGRPPVVNHYDIRLLYSQGLSLSKIAKRVGCSKTSVYKSISKLEFTKSEIKSETPDYANLDSAVQKSTGFLTDHGLPKGIEPCHETEKPCLEVDTNVTGDTEVSSK